MLENKDLLENEINKLNNIELELDLILNKIINKYNELSYKQKDVLSKQVNRHLKSKNDFIDKLINLKRMED